MRTEGRYFDKAKPNSSRWPFAGISRRYMSTIAVKARRAAEEYSSDR
jgi:hypothetical protein